MEITWNPQTGRQHLETRIPQRNTITQGHSRDQDQVADIIRYDAHYQVQICTEHGYVIRNVARHLAGEHALSLRQRRFILAAHEKDGCIPPEKLQLPTHPVDPIPGLTAPVPAFHCNGQECRQISVSKDHMRQHCNKKHNWKKTSTEPEFWHRVMAQTFFTGGGMMKYFAVRAPSSADPITTPQQEDNFRDDSNMTLVQTDEIVAGLSQQQRRNFQAHLRARQLFVQQHELEIQKADAEIAKHDRTGWFNRTEWPRHFAGRNLVHIAHCSRLPDKEEVVLIEVVRLLNEVWNAAVAGLSTLDQETRRWLRSAKASDPDVRPIGRLQTVDALERYAGYLRRFLCYIMRLWCADVEARERHVNDDHHGDDDDESDHDSDDEEEEEDDKEDDEDDRGDITSDTVHRDHDKGNSRRRNTLPDPAAARPVEIDRTGDARALFPWQSGQKELFEKLYLYITDENKNGLSAEEGLALVLEICHHFIFFKVGHDPFRSGLVHFMAVLGIDEENRRLKRASDYSYILAGVVYCVRLLAAEKLIPREDREDEERQVEVVDRFLHLRRQFLADGSYTPMSVMLSLLAYSKSIAMHTGNRGSVSWSRDKRIMYYRGHPIEINLFRRMVHDVLGRAEDMLWTELMWVGSRRDRFTIPLEDLRDDLKWDRHDHSFLSREDNKLRHGCAWMLARMQRLTGEQRLQARGRWQPTRMRRYLRLLHRFWRLLAICIHVQGGQPARGPELLSIRFRNGGLQERNIYVMDGQMTIITRYHKSQSLNDRPKIVPRFLPWRCGQILAVYLAYVQPFQEHLRQVLTQQAWSDYVWYNNKGSWETDQLTAALQHETALGLGHAYGTLDYRHIAVSIGREVIGESFASGYKEEMDEVEEPEEEEESALELQSGRGEAVGSTKYGVPIDMVNNLTVKSLTVFRTLSDAWHQFLQLDSTRPKPPRQYAAPEQSSSSHSTSLASRTRGHKRDLTLSALQGTPSRSRTGPSLSGGVKLSSPPLDAASTNNSNHDRNPNLDSSPQSEQHAHGVVHRRASIVNSAMRKLFGDGPVRFNSPEQKEAVDAVLARETPLVVVLPTGGGKTLVAMLPAVIDPEGVIIMVTPFRALTNDMVMRFRKDGIDCREWRHGENNAASVVVVSADIAVSYGFLSYAQLLLQKGGLRYVFIDESHLVFTSSDWRPKLAELRALRLLTCPMVLLTATLPPMLVYELEEAMGIRQARYIRASTVRPFHRYHVQRSAFGRLLESAVALCRGWQQRLGRQKGVVYCCAKQMCDDIAAELGCSAYHAAHLDRAETLEKWRRTGGLIVATSALGTGVDIPGIMVVIHVDRPWTMIDFAQESGRAGRGGEMVDSIILAENDRVEQQLSSGQLSIDATAVASMIVSRECRRLVMSEYLDGVGRGRRCTDLDDGARCDRCGEGLTVVMRQKQEMARAWRQMERCLDEMTTGCALCWVLGGSAHQDPHEVTSCTRWPKLDQRVLGQLRGYIRYPKGVRSCHRCGIDQRWCATGQEEDYACQWPHVLVPVVGCATGSEVGFQMVQELGFRGQRNDLRAFGAWLGRKHHRRVWDLWMSNAMVVLIRIIEWTQEEEGV